MRKINFEDIMTFDQVAEKIGLTVETLQKWREKGMPTIKIDKYLRIYWPDVLEWIVKQKEKIAADPRQQSMFNRDGK
jgi:hypothetical protein